MATLHTGGRAFDLGSADSMANPLEEKPRMRVQFSYHFAIDSFEVTQGQWREITGNATQAKTNPGIGDSLPVYHVSWFDAVLFCNARSLASGLDTVYRYTSVIRDAKGNARDLIGLTAHFDKLGFRLPTEAEWQWAASEGGETDRPWGGASPEKRAWYIANANGQVHVVGTKEANQFGLHDMLGNVMEWTQDWKVGLRAGGTENFAGGLYPATLEEKVVKGGSYRSAIPQLRPGSRNTVYPVTAASVLDDLGFRCVIGRIPLPTFFTADGNISQGLDALQLLLPDAAAHHQQARMRIALVRTGSPQNRILQVVDVLKNRLEVKELSIGQLVFAPVLSPDGQWVAFSTTGEGMTKAGEVKVIASDLKDTASLWSWAGATLPRWHVDPATKDTFLIASNHAIDNTEPDFHRGKTLRVRMRGGKPQESMEVLSSGAYHDGLSPNGKFLASGYRQLRLKELSSGSEAVLFAAPTHGKSGEDTAQACNVSWRPRSDDSSQILFLDFGSLKTSSLVGRPYGVHEIAFLIDARGPVVGQFAVPAGYTAFADLEWSNHPQYAVTILEDSDRRPMVLAVLDVKKGITTPILTGTGMLQPSLWFSDAGASGEGLLAGMRDSLFRYEDPKVSTIQGGFAQKVRTFFIQADRIEAVIVGSSHTELGLYSDLIRGGKCVNLSMSSTWHTMSELLLNRYVLPHAPQLKAVVFNVLPGLFAFKVDEPVLREAVFPSRGYQFDLSHQFWKAGLPKELKEMAITLPPPGWYSTDSMGNYSAPSNGWGPDSLPLQPWVVSSLDTAMINAHYRHLAQIVDTMKAKGLAILFVETPKHPGYAAKGKGYTSYVGPSVDDAEKIHQLIQKACSGHPQCVFYDAHQFGKHDYGFTEFYDHDHLSRQGALKLSSRIDSVLAELLSKQP